MSNQRFPELQAPDVSTLKKIFYISERKGEGAIGTSFRDEDTCPPGPQDP